MENVEQLLISALKLPPTDRAQLADSLLASLDELPPTELDALWAAEAERRLGEIRNGKVQLRTGEEVFAALRDRIK